MLKQVIKRFIPKSIRDKRTELKDEWALRSDSKLQRRRFSRYHSRMYSSERAQIETQILFHTHQIEKGLSHNHFRPGFGKHALKDLSVLLDKIKTIDPTSTQGFVYEQALSAIHAYVQRHKSIDFDLSYMSQLFSYEILKTIGSDSPIKAGAFTLDCTAKEINRTVDFKTLSDNRYAIREYDASPVTNNELMEAIRIATKAPSVCNRQSARVYIVTNQDKIKSLLDIQGGYRGYPTPPALLFITSDIRAFMNHQERNEPFVDGGIFSMSLLYSLEYIGLAACPLNAMFTDEQDTKTREILNMPDYEYPVMYISVGHFPKHAQVCYSSRFPAESITTIVK